MASPSCARISAASRASGSPDTLAEVVGSGPTPRASARGAGWSGHAQPDRRRAAGQRRRQRDVRALRARRRSARPARTPRRAPRPPGVMTADLRGLGGIVEQQHDPLVRRPALRREQPLDAARRGERHRDPVDRVGREGDDAAGAEHLDGRRAARRRRRADDPVRRSRGPASAARPRHRSAAPRSPRAARLGGSTAADARLLGHPLATRLERRPAGRARAPRSSAPRPPRRAAGRRSGRRPGPPPARSASPPRARPRRASRGRSTGRRSPASRPAARRAAGPASGRPGPWRRPGATNSRNLGMADRDVRAAREPARGPAARAPAAAAARRPPGPS